MTNTAQNAFSLPGDEATAENMIRLLGSSETTEDDAQRFAAHLIAFGWELFEDSDGQLWCRRYNDEDVEMDEDDRQAAIAECFRTHEISLDGGTNFLTADEAMPRIIERGLWNALAEMMHDATRERVHAELAPCSELAFLRRYLELAPFDLILP